MLRDKSRTNACNEITGDLQTPNRPINSTPQDESHFFSETFSINTRTKVIFNVTHFSPPNGFSVQQMLNGN